MNDNQKWEIIQGDALKVLSGFAPNTFDAVITDPPYASGGRTQSEKNKSTARKYSSMGENAPPPFDGDAKDQRSWTRWAAEWLYEARKASPVRRCVCSSTGGSCPQPPMPFNGRGGSGGVPLSGIRATAVLRRAASASRRSTLSGVPMAICLSAVRCPACQGCSSMAIHRAAFILRRNPCSLCGTL